MSFLLKILKKDVFKAIKLKKISKANNFT